MLAKQEVRYIASLSRIHLEEEEVEFLTKDLAEILGYIEKLQTLDVTQIKPTTHVLPLKNVFREDKVRPSLPQDEALKSTNASHKGFFKVPQVIE